MREGEEVYAHFTEPRAFKLKVVKVERKTLGELSDDEVKRDGVGTLEEFEELWRDLYGEWKPGRKVYVVRFRKL